MATLHVQLLGAFHLFYIDADGGSDRTEPVTALDSARLQALLAYLLLHRYTPIPRQQMAFAFWPDSSEAQARANLRRTLHLLRQAWPDAARFINIDRQMLQWRGEADFTFDVADFEQDVEAFARLVDHDPTAAQARAAKAIALYQGDLLPNCYDDWIEPLRERFRRSYGDMLAGLVDLLEARRAYGQAIGYAERLLQQDLLREQSHATLLRLHLMMGDRAAALSAYYTCASVLQQELGVEPGPELQAAYAQLVSKDAPFVVESTIVETSVVSTPSASPRGEGLRLVGRHPEWQQLRAAWRQTEAGRAHLVCIQGEAGMGKSRLAAEVGRWAREQGAVVVTARSYAMADRLAFGPIVDLLRQEPLYTALQGLDPVWLTEAARLLPELLVAHPDLPRPQVLSERWQRQRLFEALARGLSIDRRAKLLVLDDLHWSDPETLEWLGFLLRFAPQARLLVVGTMRPEEVEPSHPARQLARDLQRTDQLHEIVLAPLSPEETGQLAAQVAVDELDVTAVRNLHGLSGGNPLFVVELLRAGGLEARDSSLAANGEAHAPALPSKIQAVIQSRLSLLSPEARQLAYVAATVGRAFAFDTLLAASGNDEDGLVQSLDELWQRRIVREREARTFDFSHDLIREATYEEISPVQRPILHQRVARALEEVYQDDVDNVSAQLATHHERAGAAEQAVVWYQRAANVARLRLDDVSAIAYQNRALARLEDLPPTRRKREHELRIRLQQHKSLRVVEGYSSPTIGANAVRAVELCRMLSDPHHLCMALGNLRVYYQTRAGYRQGLAVGQEMLAAAREIQQATTPARTEDAIQVAFAHRMLGNTLLWMGELPSARSHYEVALSIKQDPYDLLFAATSDWLLGYPERARDWAVRAFVAARAEAHPFHLTYVAFNLARLAHFQRRFPALKLWTSKTRTLADVHEVPFYQTLGRLMQGRVLAHVGKAECGIRQIQMSLTRLDDMHHAGFRTYLLGLLAETYATGSRYAAALDVLDQALALVERNDERLWEAELLRLQGEFLWKEQGPQAESEAVFQAAIGVAQEQQARSLELRASVSLARLWQAIGQSVQAFELLSPLYQWFTEGFNSPDLRDARALLQGVGDSRKRISPADL